MKRFCLILVVTVGIFGVATFGIQAQSAKDAPTSKASEPTVSKVEYDKLKNQVTELQAELQAVFEDSTNLAAQVEKTNTSSKLIQLQQIRQLTAEIKKLNAKAK